MPTVLDWNPTVDPSELVRVIRESIAAGSPVVLPGDCGYVALINPTGPNAEKQLAALAAVRNTTPAVLAWGPDDPAGLGLALPVGGKRLLSRGWPAPLIVEVAGRPEWPSSWSSAVRRKVWVEGKVRFRCPEHPLFDVVTPALEMPSLVVDTFFAAAEDVLDALDDSTAAAVSSGAMSIGDQPTVVTVDESGWKIAEPGSLPVEEVEKLAARIILFVCTGNTCRSPLAEGLAKKLLADRLGCRIDDLPSRGFWVVSAGVSASSGSPAAHESIAVAAELGSDLSQHESRPVNPQLLAAADDAIAMTRGHAYALATRYPGIGPEPILLCGDEDLDDPIGAGLGVYRECARTILRHLEKHLPAWVGS
jgi:protein-tyrosine-phosphatase/tRNA A37 threonylcarbamoyladenosine synthetase subunit TsaC/SUA5/YrdC